MKNMPIESVKEYIERKNTSVKVAKKPDLKPNAFLPYMGTEIEKTLIEAGAIKYDEFHEDPAHPNAIRYGGACWMDSAENLEAGLSTIIQPNTVLAYGPSEKTKSGWNVWNCTNGVTVDPDTGKIFTKTTPVLAALLSEELPVFLYGEAVARTTDGWSVQTKYGLQQANIGEAYWLYRGHGSINIIGTDETGFGDYWVIGPDGAYLFPLAQWHREVSPTLPL